MATITDTETQSTFNIPISQYTKAGKMKKYLQPNNKYPMRYCKWCNIQVAENYLSNHKKTTKHIENYKKLEELNKRQNINYVAECVKKELDEIKEKINNISLSKIELERHINTITNEIYNLENNKEEIIKKITYEQYHIAEMKKEYNNYDNELERLNKEINDKEIIYSYMHNVPNL